MIPPKNLVCAGCTLLCDDIGRSNDDESEEFANACEKGKQFFRSVSRLEPSHSTQGQTCELDAAISAAAKVLNQSLSPLICGLDQLTTESQQAAWKLADALGATIDTGFLNQGRASTFSLQQDGKVTATLGEIAHRSDLVVFWFCDPEKTHPRLLQRLNQPDDRPDRQIIVVDESSTQTSQLADQFIQIKREHGPAVLAMLRNQIASEPADVSGVQKTCGLEPGTLENFAHALKSARYGCVFSGQPDPDSTLDVGSLSLGRLIRDLNDVTRFVGMKLRTDHNAKSAENVLAWSTGFPFAVNHQLEYPRFNWLEFSAETVLTRRQCDAVLYATGLDGPATLDRMNPAARKHLASIPQIALTPLPEFTADVVIQVGVPGLNESGEFCRNDDVSIPLASIDQSQGTERILEQLTAMCTSTSASG